MDIRKQQINGDTVLDITQNQAVKTRLSEKQLLRKKEYLEGSIKKFEAELEIVKSQLTQINEA